MRISAYACAQATLALRQIRALPPSCDRQALDLSHISWRTCAADSTGVRKELGELFRWFHEPERLAGAVVEAGRNLG
jgi:hypothetical protein